MIIKVVVVILICDVSFSVEKFLSRGFVIFWRKFILLGRED